MSVPVPTELFINVICSAGNGGQFRTGTDRRQIIEALRLHLNKTRPNKVLCHVSFNMYRAVFSGSSRLSVVVAQQVDCFPVLKDGHCIGAGLEDRCLLKLAA